MYNQEAGNMKKKRKGAALAATLITAVVISIFAAVLLSIGENQKKTSAREENKLKAYYLAKSGVQATVDYIQRNPTKVSSMMNQESDISTIDGIPGSFKVSVTELEGSNNHILVSATATVNGVESVSQMSMLKTEIDNTEMIFNQALYANGDIEVKGSSKIKGDVRSGKSVKKQKEENIEGNMISNSPLDLPTIPVPEGLEDKGSIDVNKNATTTISESGKYSSIKMKGNTTLVFDTRNTGDTTSFKTISIAVDEFEMAKNNSSSIKIIGNGNVVIFAKNVAKIMGSINADGQASQLLIVVSDDCSFSMAGNSKNESAHLFIYAPKASISLTGTPSILGGIIVDTTKNVTGNFDLTFNTSDISGLPSELFKGVKYSADKWIK